MGQTVVEKIAQLHMTDGPERPLRAGDFLSIRPYHILTHDNTSAVIKKFKSIGAAKIHDPKQPVFALDHDIQNQAEDNQKKYRDIEAFAKTHGVDFYPAGAGIGHQIMIERGYVVPGAFVVASDSHSNMYGALSAIGTPVVRTDAAAVWATGEFWWQIPRTVQVVLKGKLPDGACGKDVIIALCGLYNHGEVLNAAVEFSGSGVATLSMDERLTIANMTTEWGALVGWFPCDQVTLSWIHERVARGPSLFSDADLNNWERNPPAPDADGNYAARITLDLGEVSPHVSGPDSVQVVSTVSDLATRRIPIQKAYLLSCVNSRLTDLEAAARALKGKKVAAGVEFYLAAASRSVQEQAEQQGFWSTLVNAGAIPLPPSCGPCIGLGTGLLQPGEVGISATNRNFKGRMGSKDAQCYLASPAVVAASAAAGYIRSSAEQRIPKPLTRHYESITSPANNIERVEILRGFPERVQGRLVFLPKDNLNTDGIYGGTYTYREDMTPEMMTRVIFENYDRQLAAKLHVGDVVVGGFNFGTGSSREQAVTALKAAGIPVVIAGSFSQTYLRNAFNNGFICIESPDFVNRLKTLFKSDAKANFAGDKVEIDFTTGMLTYRNEQFPFPPLGSVPQSLVVAGGVENLVRKKLQSA
ncbi:MAG TPA: homoaconitase [Terriglobales bacterium]|nr:homoaconitase [Terriglobales bacterium]